MRTLLSFCTCLLLMQTLWADQIVTKDGDRITGSVVKKDGDTLTIKSKNFDQVKLKWADVAEITTDQPVMVVLPSGQTVKGTIATQNGRLQVAGQNAPLADIAAIRDDEEQRKYEKFLHPGLLDLWTINGS